MISFTDVALAPGPILKPSGYSLTSAQREFVRRALAEFDAENLNDEDAQSIAEAFAEVDIKPGRELSDLIIEMGFDLKI